MLKHSLALLSVALFSASICQAKDCVEVVSAGGGYSFWNAVGAGARAAGKELGVEIYFRGPANEADIQSQETIAKLIWDLHCKALVIAPNAPERAKIVEQLNAKGIPTVYIDRDTGGADVAAVVATNNYQAGVLAGEEMAQALHGKGRVAVFRLKQDVVSTTDRERGFIAGATKAGLQIVRDVYIGSSVGDARLNAAKALSGAGGEIDGIFTPNESTTVGTLLVVKQLGLAGKIVHIGFDANKVLTDALRAGELQGLIVQRPFEMGYQGVRIAYRKAMGEPVVNPHVDTGVVVVTRANLDRPEITALLPAE